MEETPGLCATVGGFDVFPNVSNVIPGRVTHTLDVRHLDDAERRAACLALERGAAVLAAEHRVEVSLRKVPGNEAMACDPALSATLAASVRKVTASACRLPSGAGHDGVVMASLCPIAMLFVRSRDGLSHHPDEHTSVADIAVALKVLCNFLRTLPR
jgi:allantoate deiminase